LAKIDITRTELVWPGKYNEDGSLKEVEKVSLPFQTIESINTSRTDREKRENIGNLYDFFDPKEGDTFEDGWKNKLIWGDNKLVMSSLLKSFVGKIDLIYIDPPFAVGADFNYKTIIGDTNIEIIKEQSMIEEKAYRDTWGKGIDSYLMMIFERLVLIKELLSDKGVVFVNCDYRVNSVIRLLLDEIFGKENFQNEIIWYYESGGIPRNNFSRKHDSLFYYTKSANYTFNNNSASYPRNQCQLCGTKLEKWNNLKKEIDENGRIFRTIKSAGKIYKYYDDEPALLSDVWLGINHIQQKDPQRLNYPTQKPEELLERIIKTCSNRNDLIADFFLGSGTTCAVAEKLGRRWIGCDLGRWSIHTARKRLLEIENCKPFECLNLGKYERQYWQISTFGEISSQKTIYEYITFILKLYKAEPIPGTQYIHGKKTNILIHIGAVDSPITIDEINLCIDECIALKQNNLHILGWEWEMGLNDLMIKEAKGKGINLVLLNIPREVMEKQAVDKGDIKFFELAHVEITTIKKKNREMQVELKDFAMSNIDLIPPEVVDKIKKWSDYIDYWAIDWDFQNDTFMNGWVTYRTKQNRDLKLVSDIHEYTKPGNYKVMVKVVDIFGNDTSNIVEVMVN